MDLVRAEDQIEIGNLLEKSSPPLLGQAASDADYQLRVFLLQFPESAKLAADLLRRFFPDTARIDDDQVRPRRIIRRLVSGAAKEGPPSFPSPEHSSDSQKFEYRAFLSPSSIFPSRTIMEVH